MHRDIAQRNFFPIGYVSRKTGLSVHVIRAWERRYRIVEPVRTAKKRRMYSPRDVARLVLCRRAVESGHRISQLAELGTEALEALLEVDREPQSSADDRHRAATPSVHVKACLQAVNRLDERGLEISLRRAAAVLPRLSLMDDVIAPLLAEIGRRWASGLLEIVHEHMASSVIQNYLTDALRWAGADDSSPRLVAATPAGQWCQLGALMACVTAADSGWKPFYFGPCLPATEIVRACSRKRAEIVALSIAVRAGDGVVAGELDYLLNNLPAGGRLFLGGGAAVAYGPEITAAGGRYFSSLRALADALSDMACEAGTRSAAHRT
jgi:DNA-binding transcriptional MerR regulator